MQSVYIITCETEYVAVVQEAKAKSRQLSYRILAVLNTLFFVVLLEKSNLN